jgi:hypothetical protein
MAPFYSALLLSTDTRSGLPISTVIEELTENDYQRYVSAYRELDSVLNTNVFTYMKATLKGYFEALEKDMQELTSGAIRVSEPDDIVRIGIRMRSAVLAFCSALHFHQEHNYKEVIKLHGKGSHAHKRIQRVFNRLFEKSFEYRLLYYTRNSMVHDTLETIAISATAFMHEGQIRAVSVPTIDLSAIVELNDEVPAKFKEQLRSMDENPSVTEVVLSAFPLVADANERILNYLYPNIAQSCATVREFDDLFGSLSGVRCLSDRRSTNQPPPLQFSQQSWARNVIEYARNRS